MGINAENKSNKFPTDLVWGIANKADTNKPYKVSVVVEILSQAYPGINYWHTQVNKVVRGLLTDDLNVQVEKKYNQKLTDFKTEEDAIAKFGAEIEIDEVRPCKGYEWETWLEKKSENLSL